jgi:hypothetical protein
MSLRDPQAMFLAAFFLAVFATLVYFIVRSQIFAACALLVAFVLSDGIRDNFSLSVTMSSFRVSALDALCAILLGVGIFRALTLGVRSFARGLSLALFALLVVHIARGTLDFSLHEAITTSRPWIYFTAPLVFAATAPKPWDRRVWKLIASTGIALALISIPYFLIDGLHTATQYVYRNGELTTARPIVAAGALVVLQAAILLPVLGWPSRRKSMAVASAMIVVVVLVQHRTVWVAALAMAAIGFVSWSRRRMRGAQSLVFGATGVIFLMLPVLVYGFLRSGALVQSAVETTHSHSTLAWRTTSWQELIASHHSLSDVATGGPAGASWARQIAGSAVELSPHNAYVEAFLRFGLPGLVIFLGLWVVVWKGRASIPRHVGMTSTAIVLLLTSQALFGIAYSLGEVQGLIFGIFISGLTLAHDEMTPGFARLSLRSAAVPHPRPRGALSRTTT